MTPHYNIYCTVKKEEEKTKKQNKTIRKRKEKKGRISKKKEEMEKMNEVWRITNDHTTREREDNWHLISRKPRKHKQGHRTQALHNRKTAIQPGKAAWVKEGLTVMIAGARQRKDLKGKVGQEA